MRLNWHALPLTVALLLVVTAVVGCGGGGGRPASYHWTGALTASDAVLGAGQYYDVYSFEADAGEQVEISMNSLVIDTYLVLLSADPPQSPGDIVEEDDDDGPLLNSYISISLLETRTYYIYATSYAPGETGNYTLDVAFPNRSGAAGMPSEARPFAAKEEPARNKAPKSLF